MIITRDKDVDYNLIQLISVEKSLYHLYNKLENATNKNQYLEYLKVTLEVEDKILNSIPFTLENSKQLYKRFFSLIYEKEGEEEINCILERINNYLERKFFSKPFKSIYEDENTLVISNSARCDYLVNLLFLLSNEIKKEENILIKKALETPFYHLCYANKAFEKVLVSPLSMPALNSRKRCINFGHEKSLVDKEYKELAFSIMNIILDELFQYPDIILNENSEGKAFQKVNLINLKSGLYLLHSEEIYDTYQAQYNIITKESPYLQEYFLTTTQNILSTLKRSYEEVNAYEKRKNTK